MPLGRELGLAAGVLVLGLLVLALLLTARGLHVRTEVEDIAWVQAIATVESDVAISHLWVEEHVSGDRVDLEEIDARLGRARALIEALLGDANTRVGVLELRPLGEDPELRQEARRLERSLEQFRQISEDRRLGLERGLAVGIGSSFDVEYDAVFHRLLGHVQVLEAALVERREAGRRRESHTFLLLGVAWTLLIVAVSVGLWHRERRRLAAEAALERSREQLARVQRTEAVGRLAGGLAHDLDNYLAAIRAQCELASMRVSPGDPVAVKMTTAIAVVDKAASLVDRLLAFHRGARVGRLEPVDLNAVLEGLESMIVAALGAGVELRLELEEGPLEVAADPVGLEQVVINLAVNAKDAMPGGGRLTVATSVLAPVAVGGGLAAAVAPGGEAQGEWIRLSVRDTGTGIDAAELERIFEPFWSTKAGGHSGLGLAIVDSVVHQMGGRVRVVSEPGWGTEFIVDLPRRDLGAALSSSVHLGRASLGASE